MMLAIGTGVRWNISVVLICISFVAGNGEHFFMCFLVICISSLEKVLFSSVFHFFIGSLKKAIFLDLLVYSCIPAHLCSHH
jgi:hypothetical protein